MLCAGALPCASAAVVTCRAPFCRAPPVAPSAGCGCRLCPFPFPPLLSLARTSPGVLPNASRHIVGNKTLHNESPHNEASERVDAQRGGGGATCLLSIHPLSALGSLVPLVPSCAANCALSPCLTRGPACTRAQLLGPHPSPARARLEPLVAHRCRVVSCHRSEQVREVGEDLQGRGSTTATTKIACLQRLARGPPTDSL